MLGPLRSFWLFEADKSGDLVDTVRRFWALVLAMALAASVLSTGPALAQGDQPDLVPEESPEVPRNLDREAAPGEILPLEQLPAGQDEPTVESPVLPELGVERAGKVDLPVSAEAGKGRGWLPGMFEGDVAPGRSQRVDRSPVSVKLDVEDAGDGVRRSDGNSKANRVVVNVLRPEHARQISPYSAVAMVGFEDDRRSEVAMSKPFEISLDLSDVALGAGGAEAYDSLTISRFENCELFEQTAEVRKENLEAGGDPESLPAEVICDVVEELEADFDLKTRMLTAGDTVTDYWLEPPYNPDLTIAGNPVTVDAPTRLSDLVGPGSGPCHWAACRSVG